MTQDSMPWGGIATGDATTGSGLVNAPYSDDEWAFFKRMIMQSQVDLDGVIITGESTYVGNLLEVSNPSGTTIRVAPGAAMVHGRLYLNTANVDEDINGDGTGWYRVVLQKLEAAQTVRIYIIKAQASRGATNVTQDASTWEISLAVFYFDDSTNTISQWEDTRAFLSSHLPMPYRQGGSAGDWTTPGSTDYETVNSIPTSLLIQSGCTSHSYSAVATQNNTVTFPLPFAAAPLVFLQQSAAEYFFLNASPSGNSVTIVSVLRTGTWTGTLNIYWLAIGYAIND